MKPLAAFLMLLSGQAAAQSNCADRDMVVQRLQSSYGEQIAGGGLYSEDRVFELWFSPAKGTWTILQTRADGVTCIMASGHNWRQFTPKKIAPGEDG